MLTDPGKRCGCGAGHLTFGACMRAKSFRLGSVRGDVYKRWDGDLRHYHDARVQGLQPEGILRHQVDAAIREAGA